MNSSTIAAQSGFSRVRLFMALSRTPHGLLDMTTPALGALLWLGGIPALSTAALGLLTAFAGYTAVYSLNDLVDYRVDRAKMMQFGLRQNSGDLDSVYARHPLAQGLLSLREALLWTITWGIVALLGAYALNPTCAWIFVAGCVAEAIYCKMLRVSWLRTLVSGGVKTAGAIAAVFAVTPDPSPVFLLVLFLWLFFWEIGGQNVPNDWSDLEEDRKLEAETIPVRFGPEGSAFITVVTLAVASVLSLFLYWATPAPLHPIYLAGATTANIVLLLVPGFRLYISKNSGDAALLFNRSSYYPSTMLTTVIVSSMLTS